MMSSVLFVDESGDTGVRKVRTSDSPGSSEFFVMSGVLVQPASVIHGRKVLNQLCREFKRPKLWKHATDLGHFQKVHFCKTVASMHLRFFGVVSNKETLGAYSEQIEWKPSKFYNKCAKYLLEMVGSYLGHFDPFLAEPRIVFENRNHDYDALIRYIQKVRENPIYPQSNSLELINPFGIVSKKKDEEVLLRFADLVAHSVYTSISRPPENFGNSEPRYLQELSPRFAADTSGQVLGSGIKCIHNLDDLRLDKVTRSVFLGLRAKPRPMRKQ